jgi:aldose 1-epimerase
MPDPPQERETMGFTRRIHAPRETDRIRVPVRARVFCQLVLSTTVVVAGCGPGVGSERGEEGTAEMVSYDVQPFGALDDGTEVSLFTLTNENGISVSIANYGGIVTRLSVPDRDGNPGDIVLGHDSLGGYLGGHPYFGAIVGRYGNRIAGGRFTLDGVEYELATNNGDNHLHGGVRGFDKVVWEAEPYRESGEAGVKLAYVSADGEEGYPGLLAVTVTYALTDADELRIDYTAETNAPTVVNLTHHSYFNLAGHGAGDVLDHELLLFAGRFTPVDAGLIPTGELRSVDETPFDFRMPTVIGSRIDNRDEQLERGGGYDHNFVFDTYDGRLRLAGRVYEPTSGRMMIVFTSEPGIQFYSGNFLDGSDVGKGGARYEQRSGFCLETQHFPDSPNRPEFPSTVLRPGERYQSTTVYQFTVQ